jgi:hypothetical protein
MDTPAGPGRGHPVTSSYGDAGPFINRRALLAGVAGLAIAPGTGPLVRAEAAAGGRARLDRVHAVGWSGTAEVATPRGSLRLGIETRVAPFGAARSTSWPLDRGRSAARTLLVQGGGGSVLRDGTRTPLPAPQAEHERQQYGLYGYLLLRDVRMANGDTLLAHHPGLPPAELTVAPDGRIASARYAVAAPEGGGTLAQLFRFEGVAEDRGLRWFRRMTIAQGGAATPYFTLAIDRLAVELG